MHLGIFLVSKKCATRYVLYAEMAWLHITLCYSIFVLDTLLAVTRLNFVVWPLLLCNACTELLTYAASHRDMHVSPSLSVCGLAFRAFVHTLAKRSGGLSASLPPALPWSLDKGLIRSLYIIQGMS